jgi:hypothetical protein
LKKLIAAFLLFIYLFNVGGQLALHHYFSILSDRFFTEQTAKGLYNVSDLTEVKLPVNMPGITDWKGYENISGQIKFENISYNYVKMKITRTALYLMCIPDYQTTRLANQNVIDAKQAKSVPVPKKEHVPYTKTTLSDKFSFAFTQFAFTAFSTTRQTQRVQHVQRVIFHHLSIPDQPPRLSC